MLVSFTLTGLQLGIVVLVLFLTAVGLYLIGRADGYHIAIRQSRGY